MKPLIQLTFVLTMLAVAGCSAGQAATTPVTPTTAATVAVETTTSSTTTTTTTSEPEPDIESDVEAAYLRSYEVFTTCHLNLPDCDVESDFAEVYMDGSYDRLTEAVLERQGDDLVYEPPDDPAHARTEIFDISLQAAGGTAVVSYCTYSGGKEFVVADDGSRTPVGLNNTAFVEWGNANLSLADDGVWRIYDFTDVDQDVVLISDIDRLREEGMICEESA